MVTTAIARETVGFIWAIAHIAQPAEILLRSQPLRSTGRISRLKSAAMLSPQTRDHC
jgi:hypothetical protein